MKKIGVGVLILIISVSIYSQEAFPKYISIQNFSGLPTIQVSDLNDLVQLAKQAKVSTAFLLKRGTGDSSTLLVQIDTTYYSFEMNGFATVGDFRQGKAHGFKSGESFSEAQNLGIQQFDLYAFYKRNSFASVDDAKQAFSAGFVSDKGTMLLPVLPLLIKGTDVKDLIARIPVFNRYLPRSTSIQGTSDKASNNLVDNDFVLIDPTKRNGDPGRSQQFTESQMYYLALADGLDSYKAYAELSDAVANGFGTIADAKTGKQRGFDQGSQFYAARADGFTEASDYKTARQLRIKAFQDYRPVKELADRIAAVMQKQSVSFGGAAYTIALESIPHGKTYSLQSVIDLINATIAVSPETRSYLSMNRFTYSVDSLRAFLQKGTNDGLGKYDADGDVFIRK